MRRTKKESSVATRSTSQQREKAARVTVPEAVTGPIAGAVLGYGVFAILLVIIGALFAGDQFSVPEENWKNLGFGASIFVGALLFVG